MAEFDNAARCLRELAFPRGFILLTGHKSAGRSCRFSPSSEGNSIVLAEYGDFRLKLRSLQRKLEAWPLFSLILPMRTFCC